MKHRGSALFVLTLCSLVFLGQGCLGGSSTTTGPDGGVYKTSDRGETWVQKRILLKGPSKPVSLGDDVILSMSMDPQDHQAIYAGSAKRGLVSSLNGGDSWEEVENGPAGEITSIAVDPKSKCTMYATVRNKIFKTENCNRDWEEIFFDPKTDKTFTAIAADWYNPTILFAGTSEGDIFKSTDAGLSWLVSKRADARITSIVFDPHDSRKVFIGTLGDGLWKTLDAGNTWVRIRTQFNDFSNARRITHLVIDPQADPPALYSVSKYGILKSADEGETWEALQLTSQPNTVEIRGFVVNPREGKELTYITTNTYVASSDGGVTWNAKKLPSTRIANQLLLDPLDGKTMYIGFGPAPKE